MCDIGLQCICVTFIDDLSKLGIPFCRRRTRLLYDFQTTQDYFKIVCREENKGISRINHVGEFTSKSFMELCCNQN
jgi:hypothetical protein